MWKCVYELVWNRVTLCALITGETFTYANWAKYEPNDDDQNCEHGVFMSSNVNYAWMDAQCDDKHYIICQRGNLCNET